MPADSTWQDEESLPTQKISFLCKEQLGEPQSPIEQSLSTDGQSQTPR